MGPTKVQILETFECPDHTSPNSCQFSNSKLVFVQILNQFSLSWGITPVYFFLAEIVYTFNKRSLPKYKFGEINLSSWNVPEILALWWAPFVKIILSFSQESTEELSLMTLKSDAKFKEKLTCGFKYDMKDLVNFPKYIRFELKKYRGVVFHDTEQWYKNWI